MREANILPESELLDSLLIQQKDRLINLLNDCNTIEKAEAIAECLLTVKGFWLAAGYGYKYYELRKRLLNVTNKQTQNH